MEERGGNDGEREKRMWWCLKREELKEGMILKGVGVGRLVEERWYCFEGWLWGLGGGRWSI